MGTSGGAAQFFWGNPAASSRSGPEAYHNQRNTLNDFRQSNSLTGIPQSQCREQFLPQRGPSKPKPTQAIDLAAAPLASLFLILGLLAFAIRQPASTGIRIPLLRVAAASPQWHECPDEVIFISLFDGKLRINHNPMPLVELGPKVKHIMEYRAEPTVYVVADANIPYTQLTEILDNLSGAVRDIHIGLISGANQRVLDQNVSFFCSLRWPESEFNPSRPEKQVRQSQSCDPSPSHETHLRPHHPRPHRRLPYRRLPMEKMDRRPQARP